MPPKRQKSTARPARSVRKRTLPRLETLHQPIVRPDEKRELILAHAAMRRPHDPVQLASLWAGVAATFVVIVLAWWWASKPGYLRAFASPARRELRLFKQETAQFGNVVQSMSSEKIDELMHDLANAATRLDALSTQVAREQNALDRMAALVSGTSSRPTLFQTTSTSTSSE